LSGRITPHGLEKEAAPATGTKKDEGGKGEGVEKGQQSITRAGTEQVVKNREQGLLLVSDPRVKSKS